MDVCREVWRPCGGFLRGGLGVAVIVCSYWEVLPRGDGTLSPDPPEFTKDVVSVEQKFNFDEGGISRKAHTFRWPSATARHCQASLQAEQLFAQITIQGDRRGGSFNSFNSQSISLNCSSLSYFILLAYSVSYMIARCVSYRGIGSCTTIMWQ